MAAELRKVPFNKQHSLYLEEGSNKFIRYIGTQESTKLHGDTAQKTQIMKFVDVGIWNLTILLNSVKSVAVPLQAWSDPQSPRKLRFPDFMTTAQDGGKVVSSTQRPPLPPGNTPGTHFC